MASVWRFTVGLCFLGLLAFFYQHSHQDTSAHDSRRENAEFIVAFHLGLSYSTAVAYLRNGTISNLSKVPGSPNYIALMEKLIQMPPSEECTYLCSEYDRWFEVWRTFKRFWRIPGTREEASFSHVMAALKAESEAILQSRLATVHIAAPWIHAWETARFPDGYVFVNALHLAGLELDAYDEYPLYTDEVNAVMAANGRQICREHWCSEGGAQDWTSRVFYISFTNHSVYTSFQFDQCFYPLAWHNNLAAVDTSHGLSQLSKSNNSTLFWEEIQNHLLSYAIEDYKRTHGRYSVKILVAGEAANNSDFSLTIQKVVMGIEDMYAESSAIPIAHEVQKPSVELLMSKDPSFAGAKGATAMMRTAYWGYCDGEEWEYAGEQWYEEWPINPRVAASLIV